MAYGSWSTAVAGVWLRVSEVSVQLQAVGRTHKSGDPKHILVILSAAKDFASKAGQRPRQGPSPAAHDDKRVRTTLTVSHKP